MTRRGAAADFFLVDALATDLGAVLAGAFLVVWGRLGRKKARSSAMGRNSRRGSFTFAG